MTEFNELTLPELVEEFEFLGEWEEQCRYLIELGEQLPDLPAAEKNDTNRVYGCQARVWLVPETRQTDDRIWFHAKSDARLVDGLIVILSLLFNGKTAREVLATDVRGPFKQLGLEAHLVPQRRNGLYAMVERVRSLAQARIDQSDSPQVQTLATPASRVSTPSVAVVPQPSPTPSASIKPQAKLFDVAAMRAQFPVLQQTNSAGRAIVYLDSASSSQKPRAVIEKELEVYEQYYANAYRGVYRFGDRVSRELDAVRERVAGFMGAASVEEVFFTSGTTMGMNLIAHAWGRKFLRPGDEILLTIAEHHANIVPWQWVAQHTGAIVKFAPLTSTGDFDRDAFSQLITPRTKVVSVTAVSNVLGTVMPLADIVRQARHVGALMVVDAAQSAAHLPLDVVQADLDFVAFSGHKLYGPSGVGVCYGKRALLEAMDPFLCGGHMISQVSVDGFQLAPLPAKFEAGTPAIAQAIALGAAIDFLQTIGLEAVHAHEQQLLGYALERLSSVPGLRMFGPRTLSRGAIVPFVIDGAAAQDIASLLDVSGVCVRHGHHCTMPLHDWLGEPATIRASFGIYNTLADVDRLVDGLLEARRVLKLPN